jgi:hypothetical protein
MFRGVMAQMSQKWQTVIAKAFQPKQSIENQQFGFLCSQ